MATQAPAVAPGLGRISIATRQFLDTNVIVYALDDAEPRKRDISQALLQDPDNDCIISTQVMIETYSAATRKLGIEPATATSLVHDLSQLEVVPTHSHLVLQAIETSQSHNISIWDALILEAARAAGCPTLITEDLAHGSSIRGVRIVNPYAT